MPCRDVPARRGASIIAHAKAKKKGSKGKKAKKQKVAADPVPLAAEGDVDFSDDGAVEEDEDDSDMYFDGPTIDTSGLPW